MRSTPRRIPVNKRRSAAQFRHYASKTKAPNIAPPPMRGGYRM